MIGELRKAFTRDLSAGRAIELDAIRGLAIFLVIGWHFKAPTGILPFDLLLLPGASIGWMGVDLFFVLSGFLIGGLIVREIDATGHFQAKRFLIRRAFRLWPVLYVYLLLMLLKRDFWDFFPQAFFHVANYFKTPLSQIWSLSVEEQFYIVAALVLPWVAKVRIRRLAMALAVVAVGITLLRTIMWFQGEPNLNLQWETHYRADALIAGVLLVIFKIRRPLAFAKLQRGKLLWIASALLAGVLASAAWQASHDYRPLLTQPLGIVIGVCLIMAFDGQPLGRLGKALARPLAFLGIYSYSIYIWHNGIGRLVEPFLFRETGSEATTLIGVYAAIIAFSVVVTRLIERPMIDLRNRLFPSSHAVTVGELRQDEPMTAQTSPSPLRP